jgi:hypothetical protein
MVPIQLNQMNQSNYINDFLQTRNANQNEETIPEANSGKSKTSRIIIAILLTVIILSLVANIFLTCVVLSKC